MLPAKTYYPGTLLEVDQVALQQFHVTIEHTNKQLPIASLYTAGYICTS